MIGKVYYGSRSMKRYLLIGLSSLLLVGCKTDQDTVGYNQPTYTDDSSEEIDSKAKVDAATYIAAGDLASSRGQFAQASEQYKKALASKPNDQIIIRKIALSEVKSGQLNKAIESWKKYLSITNGSIEGYGSLGFAYELAGNQKEAEKTYLEGISKHPAGRLVRINYGLMLVRQNKVDQAVEQMSSVLQPHEVNYNIGSVYEQLHRKDLAQFYFKRSLECNPDFAPAKQKVASIVD